MRLYNVVTTSFILSMILTLIAGYLKLTHAEGADIWLALCLIPYLVFIVLAIYEVRTSRRIGLSEKTMWTFAFIFFISITGLIYMLVGRRRIANAYPVE
jgi:hypothetical protein